MSEIKRMVRSSTRRKSRARPAELREDLMTRLERAEGQLRGIKRMVGEDAYCIDVLQQISAVRGALQKLALMLLRDHLETCVSEAMIAKNSSEKVRELIETVDRFIS